MASKHFRKLEEERMLAAAAAANEASEAQAAAAAPAPRAAGFSFADLAGESSEESSSDSEDEGERERRAAAAEARANGQSNAQQQQKQQQQQRQKQQQKQKQQAKKKKQQEKKKAAAANDAWTPDDDAMLANIAAAQAASEAETDVLQPDPKYLDPQSELKRIFGGNVVKAAMREEQQGRRGAQGRRGRGGGDGRGGAAARARRTILVQPRDHWPPYTPGGLEMQVTHTTSDELHFSFWHGDDYQQAQREYEVAASSHDPNAIVGVLQFYPYHIGSLMQLAEVHSIRGGELERAGDMYERALFAMERGAWRSPFLPAFAHKVPLPRCAGLTRGPSHCRVSCVTACRPPRA
jgi:hypothetical protein